MFMVVRAAVDRNGQSDPRLPGREPRSEALRRRRGRRVGPARPIGALVSDITPNSPAEAANLQTDDVILEFNHHAGRRRRPPDEPRQPHRGRQVACAWLSFATANQSPSRWRSAQASQVLAVTRASMASGAGSHLWRSRTRLHMGSPAKADARCPTLPGAGCGSDRE